MSYTTFLTNLNTALVTAGLTAAPEPRDGTLATAGRGNFDGIYLIVNETGVQPWPELSLNPVHWRARLRIEVGTTITNDPETQSGTVESRGRAVFEQTVYAQTPIGRQIYNWQEPTLQRAPQDKRMIWIMRFSARFTEP